ncbi:hypothetical protein CHUAL_005878 [Chamberlinius hualienensis]
MADGTEARRYRSPSILFTVAPSSQYTVTSFTNVFRLQFVVAMFALRLIKLNIVNRCYSLTKSAWNKPVVPLEPVFPPKQLKTEQEVELDAKTVNLIETLSLVRFNEEEGEKRLRDSIIFANQLFEVDVSNVEPLYTVLENRPLFLREDCISEPNSRKQLLKCAVKSEEDYFVVPPGNIELDDKST